MFASFYFVFIVAAEFISKDNITNPILTLLQISKLLFSNPRSLRVVTMINLM